MLPETSLLEWSTNACAGAPEGARSLAALAGAGKTPALSHLGLARGGALPLRMVLT
jgi:hypothetical protein